ncbi:MAG TPA: M56 family metallopeptidase, partial [Candidatus Merdenecus merdavium]|nr:M56 family metallopeptidase [Candidatus Merdenecus merdavium]
IINTINTCIYMVVDSLHLIQALTIVWIIGAIIKLISGLNNHNKFMKLIDRWSEEVKDEKVLRSLNHVLEEFNISNKKIRILQNGMITSPCVVGVHSPKIIIPTFPKNMSEDTISLLIKHEIVHYKRHDNAIKIMVFILTTILWFFPYLKNLKKSLYLYCEISCDEETLNHSDKSKKREYGKIILDIAVQQKKEENLMANNFITKTSNIHKRIEFIVREKKKAMNPIIQGMYSMIIVVLLLFFVQISQGNEVLAESYDKLERKNILNISESKEFDELYVVKRYHQYINFGLLYKEEESRFYYDKQLVRQFNDKDQKIAYWCGNGSVDVWVIRDKKGNIQYIESVDAEEG